MVIFPTYTGMLTSIDGLERGESSKGRKRAREAIRYASRTPEQIQARRERVRARRQNLTPKEKEEINARRREKRQRMTLEERNASQRACRQSLTLEERQERNARQRARRQSLPPEERRALLAQRNASYASRRDTPCMDSIVSNCPMGSLLGHASSSSYAFSYPSTLTQTFSTIQGNLESIPEGMEDDHIVFTSKGDANTVQCKELTSVQCPTSTSVDSSSLAPDDSICPGSPTESFNVDDDFSHMTEEEDDEYFAFAGRGNTEDCDDMVDAFTTDNIVPDPYDCVYQNIPKSTHTLVPKPDCKHCGAKRFQYETNGFCCQSGKIKLAQSEPPLELQMLYTSSDSDDVHFLYSYKNHNW
ncbi:hypothetical protein VPH35_004578 [Triticum aestivum]|uniref:uncharacterized protein n=1 Tax=Triticum aestivum TaxID=4565 RepID=UPI001D005C78|nr:uncharacterized protein LOC123066914 [Triticum aestivum]